MPINNNIINHMHIIVLSIFSSAGCTLTLIQIDRKKNFKNKYRSTAARLCKPTTHVRVPTGIIEKIRLNTRRLLGVLFARIADNDPCRSPKTCTQLKRHKTAFQNTIVVQNICTSNVYVMIIIYNI